MELNERIMLANQYEILKRLDANNVSHYDKLIEILRKGYSYYYSQISDEFFDEVPVDRGGFILEVLSMYDYIDNYKSKHPNETDIIDHSWSSFKGFDGNTECSYMGLTHHIMEKQGLYTHLSNASMNLNSHRPTLSKYGSMLNEWKLLGKRFDLNHEEVLRILNGNSLDV